MIFKNYYLAYFVPSVLPDCLHVIYFSEGISSQNTRSVILQQWESPGLVPICFHFILYLYSDHELTSITPIVFLKCLNLYNILCLFHSSHMVLVFALFLRSKVVLCFLELESELIKFKQSWVPTFQRWLIQLFYS